MSTIKKIKVLTLLLLLLLPAVFVNVYFSTSVYADTITCADNSVHDVAESDSTNPAPLCASNGGVKAGATIQPSNPSAGPEEAPKFVKSDCKGGDIKAGAKEGTPEHCGILDILTLVIKLLSGLVGIVVVAMIIIGGIQYSASAGEPQGVAAAKKRIISAILALVLYSFMFALLQYLIPGGVIQ